MRWVLVVLLATILFSLNCGPAQQQPTASQVVDPTALNPQSRAELRSWVLTESVNKMDGTPEITLSKLAPPGAALVIRCVRRETDVYVVTPEVVSNGRIRIKFDDSAPQHENWSESTGDSALFSPEPVLFARKMAKSKTLLFEFTPFQKARRIIQFDVSGLEIQLPKIMYACDWAAIDRVRIRRQAQANKAKVAERNFQQRIAENVHPCKDTQHRPEKWCWSDPDSDSSLFPWILPLSIRRKKLFGMPHGWLA
jgi:hypothetical protein